MLALGALGSRVRSIEARIHHPFSSSLSTIRDLSVSIESTGLSPSEKVFAKPIMPCASPICLKRSFSSSRSAALRLVAASTPPFFFPFPSFSARRASLALREYQKTSWSAKVSSVGPRVGL